MWGLYLDPAPLKLRSEEINHEEDDEQQHDQRLIEYYDPIQFHLASPEWSYLVESTIDSFIKNLLVGADSAVKFPE